MDRIIITLHNGIIYTFIDLIRLEIILSIFIILFIVFLDKSVYIMTEDTLNLTKKLSRSLEDYVRAIYVISKRRKVARVRDIANILKVKPPTFMKSENKMF